MNTRNEAIRTRGRKAFTLIELLVVITIIAILAAILFPVFAQAKAAAKKTKDFGAGHWFDASKAMCPSLANTPQDNPPDYYNKVVRSAVKNHGDGIIGAYTDGHA